MTLDGKIPDEIVRLDINPEHKPDILCNLDCVPWLQYQFADQCLEVESQSFDQIHAYEVLEHLGTQGDARSFFATFYECWRILKPGGVLIASVPRWDTLWAWGDPGHRRIINRGSLVFLDRQEYEKQIGKTPMSDYRDIWKGDFERVLLEDEGNLFWFALKARK